MMNYIFLYCRSKGINEIQLTDESQIKCNKQTEISLSNWYILTHGTTYYGEKYGFEPLIIKTTGNAKTIKITKIKNVENNENVKNIKNYENTKIDDRTRYEINQQIIDTLKVCELDWNKIIKNISHINFDHKLFINYVSKINKKTLLKNFMEELFNNYCYVLNDIMTNIFKHTNLTSFVGKRFVKDLTK